MTFGVDMSVPVYIEAYGAKLTTPIFLSLVDKAGYSVWHDTTWVAQRKDLAAGVVDVPLTRTDAGIYTIVATRTDGSRRDTVRTPIFIGFGPDLPLVTYEQMIKYLRYFASSDRLQLLRDAAPENRGKAWGEFLHASDPVPETSQNEALLNYFTRIREANHIYRAEAAEGWLSDRGSVYVALGMPDGIYDQNGRWLTPNAVPIATTGGPRYIIWEYQDLQARIVFYDETGGGLWRMVPSSMSNFWLLVSRRARR
jgi:GWxTD domain-containing protein